MTLSTHKTEVVPILLEPHPNADTLSLVQVWGYQVAVKTSEWQGKTKGAYIVPDSVFEGERVKAKKLRGVVSYGMLVPVDDSEELGADLSEKLKVTRYEPGKQGSPRSQQDKFIIGGEEEAGPDLNTGPQKYDVESFERYAHEVLTPGEPVCITEKLDGSNARFVFHDGRFWVKTRNRWVKRTPDYSKVTVESLTAQGCPEEKAVGIVERLGAKKTEVNSFWKIMEETEGLCEFLKAHKGTTVFGEVYGNTNRLKYGPNRFAAFDLFENGQFLDYYDYRGMVSGRTGFFVARVAQLAALDSYDFSVVKGLSEGLTKVEGASTIREGVVVRPLKERTHPKIGRVILKCINPAFLEK